MPAQKTLEHRFVEFVPDKLQDDIIYVSIPYATVTHKCCCGWRLSRSKKGAIRIDVRDEHLQKDDPFNRPAHEIQKWVKGVVWREQHFKGKTIADIARAESIDKRYVSRLITQSLLIG